MTALRRFYCPVHGYLVTAPASSTVTCGQSVHPNPRSARTRRCDRQATTVNPNPRRAK